MVDFPWLAQKTLVSNDIIPTFHAMIRRVTFFIYPQFQLLDLSGPLSVFDLAERACPGSYSTQVISESGGLMPSSAGLVVASSPPDRSPPDTLIVVGGRGVHQSCTTPGSCEKLLRTAERARRVASVCTGAFLMARMGLLSGRKATTHWRHAGRFRTEHPEVMLDDDRIYIKDGQVWSSAGITAGIDLALALIEEDLGTVVSKAVARELVMSHRRLGGQSQFSAMLDLEPESHRIRDALHYAREHLAEDFPMEAMAAAVGLSTRQFGRVFLAETGQTPARAVERLRAEAARPRIEDGDEPLEHIAASVGFGQAERMRQAFVKLYGQSPQSLRRQMRRGTTQIRTEQL
jgi:transcriptional regulator GlxA family with amidase domain